MQLHTLKAKTEKTTRAPVGRGGKRGKTSGRGGKGQTARAGHKIRPESRDMIKKLPKRRGFGRNRAKGVRRERVRYAPVNLGALAALPAGQTITPELLLAHGLVRAHKGRAPKVKILGAGDLAAARAFKGVVFSAAAKAAVEKAGGSLS
ncbi:MAG TPA: uL15 family ribosomal protein [Candidatus Paceibacterota bacterium]|nr:uL15 family ribosomal protein [Candidatus Paceibacterota bacterium]